MHESRLVRPHSISVGYNQTGQDFFDTIGGFQDYIHSYFFSLTEDVHGNPIDLKDTITTLKKCNKYGIHGNLLLNSFKSEEKYYSLLKLAMSIGDVTAVTVIHPEVANEIKKEYPELEVHISVRYWDWLGDEDPTIKYQPITKIRELSEHGVDVINISGELHFNNESIIRTIHEYGMKAKVIINEGCIPNREFNYGKFPEFKDLKCTGSKCNRNCDKVYEIYPWMKLSRIELFKENLIYCNYDILKIASRTISNDSLYTLLLRWASYSRTERIADILLTEDKYKIFLEWIRSRRVICNNECYSCRYCENIYKRLSE